MTTTAHDTHDPHDPQDPHGGHGDHGDHPKFLAHHFDTPQQQFDSGKLGTWLFLTTEILLFSGLFCAYAVYRANHPEIFDFAHRYLDKWLGALNTIVLIFSSFTMAWAVRAAQLGQRKLCVNLLAITILCGAGFMVIKGVEYHSKWKHVVLPGPMYDPPHLPGAEHGPEPTVADMKPSEPHGPAASQVASHEPQHSAKTPGPPTDPLTNTVMLKDAPPTGTTTDGALYEQSTVARASQGPSGLNPTWVKQEEARIAKTGTAPDPGHAPIDEPNNAHIFFGIYFLMTGLHGIHVLAGMALIGWVMLRAAKGEFGPEYFSPVDFVGLYWHIVDLVWIFLFPLLYLIT
jgi:cytochrome c oxidase subunit 3